MKQCALAPGTTRAQGELERAFCCALQEDRGTLRMSAAARTDAGVHAADQARAPLGTRPPPVTTNQAPVELRWNTAVAHRKCQAWAATVSMRCLLVKDGLVQQWFAGALTPSSCCAVPGRVHTTHCAAGTAAHAAPFQPELRP